MKQKMMEEMIQKRNNVKKYRQDQKDNKKSSKTMTKERLCKKKRKVENIPKKCR